MISKRDSRILGNRHRVDASAVPSVETLILGKALVHGIREVDDFGHGCLLRLRVVQKLKS
jgi:hypothetical protein